MSITTEAQVKRRIIDLVQNLKAELQVCHPPQYRGIHDPIARHLGIVVEEASLPFDEGMYIPTNPPKIAIDRAETDPERRNFTFFHEITHHLVRQDSELYAYLHEIAFDSLEAVVEQYCNIGAAEFLVPSHEVSTVIRDKGFSIQLIEEMDGLFPASKPAIAIQLAQVVSHQCVIVVCNCGHLPQKKTANALFQLPLATQPQIFVQYSSSSPSFKYSVSRFVPIPYAHIVTAAYEGQCALSGRGVIPFRSGKEWEVPCEAFFYKSKVYAAFNITSPPSNSQLGFDF